MTHVTVSVRFLFFWLPSGPSCSLDLSLFLLLSDTAAAYSVCSLNDSSLTGDGVNCCLNGALETGLCSNDARSNQEVSSSPSHISVTSKVGISFVLLISG